MELPDDAPKTPKLYFIAADVLLVAVAVLIAFRSGTPLPPAAVYAISGCVLVGALLLVLPFLLDYNRRQEMLLTDRQNALEALARTTSSAVEQASIAVSGLSEVADLAQKTLKQADQLPHKLHERISEFKALHDEAVAAELESLQQEVNTLRASEAEKLESAADKIQRAAAELGKLESVVRKHVATIDDAAKRAEQLITSAASKAVQEVETGIAHALEDADKRLKTLREKPETPPAPAPAPVPAPAASADETPKPRASSTSAARAAATPPAIEAPVASSPTVTDAATVSAKSVTAVEPPPAPRAPVESAAAGVASQKPAPAAPAANPRKTGGRRAGGEMDTPLFADLANDHPPVENSSERAAETRPSVSATMEDAAPDETAQLAPDETQPEPALSSDGVTRLVVTAYIGIGNKLFVRGDGPGLSWDEGTPLQFVSIGKWRWETADATKPLSLKLYKNDQVECTALGTIRLEPGHQRELSANF